VTQWIEVVVGCAVHSSNDSVKITLLGLNIMDRGRRRNGTAIHKGIGRCHQSHRLHRPTLALEFSCRP